MWRASVAAISGVTEPPTFLSRSHANPLPDFRRSWAHGSPDFGVDQCKRGMSRFGSCYYRAPVIRAGSSVGGGVDGGCEVEVFGGFGQVERSQDGLLVAGEGRALGDAAVGGGEGDQVHAV